MQLFLFCICELIAVFVVLGLTTKFGHKYRSSLLIEKAIESNRIWENKHI